MKSEANTVPSIFRAMRVYQWMKNILVFLPVVAAGALFESAAMTSAAAAFIFFSLVASGVYLLDDLTDLESDRSHPAKRKRPFASGELAPVWGMTVGPGLIILGLGLSLTLNPSLFVFLGLYVGVAALYSARLKMIPLIDVFTLALLYTLRVVAGGVATGYTTSLWLLTFVGLFFLGLALLKRHVEFSSESSSQNKNSRRGYRADDESFLLVMGLSMSTAASIVLALYVESEVVQSIYAQPGTIWALVPLCIFWQSRMWLSAVRGEVDDDPIVFASKDKVSWMTAGAVMVIYFIALIGPPAF